MTSRSLICSTLSQRCSVWHSVGVSSSINGQSSSSGIYQVPPSSFIRTSPFFFSAPLFSALEESSLTHVITKIIAVFPHHTYPTMMESNFASWNSGCEIRSMLHMLPGLVLHPCHINFQVIINTYVYEHVYLSAFMNAIFMERAAGWCFDEGSRLGSRPGCRLFCGFSAYWFPPTVRKHANWVDWSHSCVWKHPFPYRAPTMVFAKPVQMLSEDTGELDHTSDAPWAKNIPSFADTCKKLDITLITH